MSTPTTTRRVKRKPLRRGRPVDGRKPTLSLRVRRTAAGLSVRDVLEALKAAGMKTASATYYGWEKGETSPPPSVVRVLARRLACEPADLLRAARLR